MTDTVTTVTQAVCPCYTLYHYIQKNGATIRADKQINTFLMECMAKALVELLKEKPLSAISVTEITQKAGVARMTFYRNYSTKEEIFEKYLDYMFEQFHRTVAERGRHASFIRYENIMLGFEFFRRESELIRCLVNNNLSSGLRDKIIQNELDLSLTSQDDIESRYLTIAYASALFGIMTAWVQGGMKDDPNQLAQLICDIYQEKIRRF